MTFRALPGAILAVGGLAVMAGWALESAVLVHLVSRNPPMVFNTALCFLLTGLALLVPASGFRRSRSITDALAAAIAAIAMVVLAEHALHRDLGIDWTALHSWAYLASGAVPGRMSVAIALAFLMTGAALILLEHVRARRGVWSAKALAFCIGGIGILAIAGYAVDAPLLFPDYYFSGIAIHTAIGLLVVSLGLRARWRRHAWGRARIFTREDDRIAMIGAGILAAVAAIAGVASFAILQGRTQTLASQNVLDSLNHRVEQFQDLIDMRETNARIAANRPALLRNLRAIREGRDDGSNLQNVQAVVWSFLSEGFSAVAYHDADGRTVAAGGRFVEGPSISVPLSTPLKPELLWNEGFILRHRVALRDSAGTVGELLAEQPLPALTQMLRSLASMGSTGDMGLCVVRDAGLLCFPQRLNPEVFTAPLINVAGSPLPMTKALRGQSGVDITQDYRAHSVVAAYSPVGSLGLGMVVKIDAAEIFMPVREQLQVATALVLVLVALGSLALRLQVKPLATKLVEAEARTRSRGHAALNASEERARLVLDSALDAFVAIDSRGDIVEWNKKAESMFGWRRDEVLGTPLAGTIIPERYREAHRDGLERFAHTTVHPVLDRRIELSALRRDGSEFQVELEITAIHAADGLLFAGFVRDITERVRLLDALREREAALHRAQLMASLAHVVTGPDGVFENWSQTMPKIIGVEPEEMPRSTREWLALVHPDDRGYFRSRAINAGALHAGLSVEYRLRRGDGQWIFLRQAAEPIGDAGEARPRWFSTIQDVTEQKRIEDEVRRLNLELERRVDERTEELQATNRELEAFSYSVSHDLRAPLRAIEGFSGILVGDHSAQLPAEGLRLLARIRHNAQVMANLIDDLLAFSRMAKQAVVRRSVALEGLVRHCLDELRDDIDARKVEVSLGPLPVLEADPALMTVVLQNLIGNALKYTHQRQDPRIEIGSVVRDGETAVYVRDNGVGFDMQYAGKLFGVFQRLHAAAEFEGTGVGLAIVQRIIQRHGGRVWAEAKPDEGATFWFTVGNAAD